MDILSDRTIGRLEDHNQLPNFFFINMKTDKDESLFEGELLNYDFVAVFFPFY